MLPAYFKTTFSSLSIRNYRVYFWSQLVSLSGNWVRLVVLAWLVLQLDNSGTVLGIVTGLQFVPALVLGPFAGLVADRIPKRLLLIGTQIVMGLSSLALCAVVGLHVVQLWMVIVITMISGVANAFDMPARQTLIASLVSEDLMQNAVTLGSLEANLARIIGPSVGALCLAWFSTAGCFFVDFLTFVCGAIGMMLLRPGDFYANKVVLKAKGQLREGIVYIRRNAVARTILLMMALIGTLACEFFVTLPLLAKNTFHEHAAMYASMTTAMGIGAILGGLIVAGKAVVSHTTVLAKYALLFAASMAALAMTSSYWLALAILVVVGATQLILTTSANAMLMVHTTPAMRGRMNGWWIVIFMGSTPVGGPLVGWISQHSSPALALLVGAIATATAGVWALLQAPRATPVPVVQEALQ
ncbi:MAG TPA: MFS transporter [Candidatus Saccharimonadales bacterium]|nr:MFS transporter [Candidatus Saccharimonadales bacterium]